MVDKVDSFILHTFDTRIKYSSSITETNVVSLVEKVGFGYL